jgi:hypothetical protein
MSTTRNTRYVKEGLMPEPSSPVLTPEQWEARDYRQSARDLDAWADAEEKAGQDDATEYVAKLGLSASGSVVAMNRAHDRVLIPPPARAVLAALALMDQPFGFTGVDVEALLRAADTVNDEKAVDALRDLAARIAFLVPPAG